ncbi:MAG: ATP-binding protein [Acidobacteriota bacterium]
MREAASRRLSQAQVPLRYADRDFEGFYCDPEKHPRQAGALARCIEFVEEFPAVERGLLLVGRCGVGKTHLSVSVLKALVLEKGIQGRFVDEAELLRRLQYSYGPDSPDTEREVMIPLMESDLLIWDDLGTGRPTEWVRETTRMVLNYRYTNRKHTILTTNWPLRVEPRNASLGRSAEQTLEERIGTRMFSRLMEMCEVLEVDGPDARPEIQKPSLESPFRKRRGSRSGLTATPSMLECPHCGKRRVKIQDRSALKKSGKYQELSCVCEACSRQFLARFFLADAAIEYPED